ncbi:MAG TPA: hypothetical protein VHL53_13025 [Acidimicrobiia bacterium]|nr:hypothetical protein [Acidimicrobiia bacterium]
MSGALAPVAAVVPFIATDLWVFEDDRRRALAGRPVALVAGPLRVTTPMTWFVACLLLWILFFPFYVLARSRPPGGGA